VSGAAAVTQEKFRDDGSQRLELKLGPTYYTCLELPTSATADQIRQAYRQKSKLYHPDTTVLNAKVAAQKFSELNEAYRILSNSEHRMRYDLQLSTAVDRKASDRMSPPVSRAVSVGHLDPKERPLSPGEMFALFILGLTFVVCLTLALILGIARGEMILQTLPPTAHPSAATVLPRSPQRRAVVSIQKSAIIEKQRIPASASQPAG
jgi:DnaJ domain